jgi:hypothetical protein
MDGTFAPGCIIHETPINIKIFGPVASSNEKNSLKFSLKNRQKILLTFRVDLSIFYGYADVSCG